MKLPDISDETRQSFLADLAGDDPALNVSAIFRDLTNQRPGLAKMIAALGGTDVARVGAMLYLLEIIERQMQANELKDRFW